MEMSFYQLLCTHTYKIKDIVWIYFLVCAETVTDSEGCKQEFSERTYND